MQAYKQQIRRKTCRARWVPWNGEAAKKRGTEWKKEINLRKPEPIDENELLHFLGEAFVLFAWNGIMF